MLIFPVLKQKSFLISTPLLSPNPFFSSSLLQNSPTTEKGSGPACRCPSEDRALRGTEAARPGPPLDPKEGLLRGQAGGVTTHKSTSLPNNTGNRNLTKQNIASSMKISHEYCRSIFYFSPRNAFFLRNPKGFPFKHEEITETILVFIQGHVVFDVLPADPTRTLRLRQNGLQSPFHGQGNRA